MASYKRIVRKREEAEARIAGDNERDTLYNKIRLTMADAAKGICPVTIYYYLRQWKSNGLLEELHDLLVSKVRLKKGKTQLHQ